MTRMEIDVLIENFLSRHQQEGTCSEIKRTWYQLSNTISLGEYLKDVVAMANSDCDEGVIIIGIDEGTRLIHDSPLPLDEARLQEFVQKNVEPTPPIEFGEISRPEGRISYIQIMRRRDRPYVIKSEHAGNRIPLRRGSRVGFATRRDLDRWYNEPDVALCFMRQPVEDGTVVKMVHSVYRVADTNAGGFLANLARRVHTGARRDDALKKYITDKNRTVGIRGFAVRNQGRVQVRDLQIALTIGNRPAAEILTSAPIVNPQAEEDLVFDPLLFSNGAKNLPASLEVKYHLVGQMGLLARGRFNLIIEIEPRDITTELAMKMFSDQRLEESLGLSWRWRERFGKRS